MSPTVELTQFHMIKGSAVQMKWKKKREKGALGIQTPSFVRKQRCRRKLEEVNWEKGEEEEEEVEEENKRNISSDNEGRKITCRRYALSLLTLSFYLFSFLSFLLFYFFLIFKSNVLLSSVFTLLLVLPLFFPLMICKLHSRSLGAYQPIQSL